MVNRFTEQLGIRLPVIGGPMYPCSNPELVAAVSEAGGIGVVQPVSLTYVHGYDFRQGLRYIRSLTQKPIGLNMLIEGSHKRYHERMQAWLDIALEEGVRFFITSLGKPDWVVAKAHAAGALVYHDVTERRWADKAMAAEVDGLIAVNNRAGGHAGGKSAQQLIEELAGYGLPVMCAGGISQAAEFVEVLKLGYQGVQMGTRFIATAECSANDKYKQAIVSAQEQDIVLSERLTGVPVSVIKTPYIEQMGLKAGPLARWLLQFNRSKHWVRMWYALNAMRRLKSASLDQKGRQAYWQAGKSAGGIDEVLPVSAVMAQFDAAYGEYTSSDPGE